VIVHLVSPTPASEAAARLGRGTLPVWFSSPGDSDTGPWRDVVACDPVQVVRGSSIEELETAWRESRRRWNANTDAGVPVAAGYLSYDLGRQFERLKSPARPRPASPWPDLEFRFFDAIWVRTAERAEIWACDEPSAARLIERLHDAPKSARPGASPRTNAPAASPLGRLEALDSPEQHLAGIGRILDYLRDGDTYQVNLARRLVTELRPAPGPPGLELHTRLHGQSPAPHAFWLAGETSCLIGNSPELFLRLRPDGHIETRPIKGTRPRAPDAAAALAHDPKELAEHTMIVDLERNDLGRICQTGSVTVSGFARVVTLPTVHHLVSTVSGRLCPGVGLADILRATFPGGSITGAPKIRAMEIIDELEGASRGPYSGATGWLGAAGDMDLAVAIRTALGEHNKLTLWVGGGIVADSISSEELRETETKAEAFARLAPAAVS
jgi:para-aminobenzoate synthetase component 1